MAAGGVRVGITGLGLVSCLGHSYETVIGRLRRGESGVVGVPHWEKWGIKSRVAGRIRDLEEKEAAAGLPKKLLPAMSTAARYCAIAAVDAVADSGLDEEAIAGPRTACIVGAGTGSVLSIYRAAELTYGGRIRRVDPFTVLRGMSSSPSAAVANLFKVKGPSYSISSACATSAHNIGHACDLIRSGAVEVALAGGGEACNHMITASFQGLRIALSTGYNDTPERASRPYDRARDGFVISGGGGVVVLENLERAEARGARIRAELLGYAANSDGHDLVLPEPDGRSAADCMRLAIEDADIEREEIDYVNTHGTATLVGDLAETAALRRTFGGAVPPFSSTKSMTGHGIGAAGVLELIFCIGMLEEGFLAPSINIEELDPELEGMPVITETVERRPRTVLTNNFGFGGTNAAIVLRRSA